MDSQTIQTLGLSEVVPPTPRLFIKVVDGQPFEHPITEENMRQAFPEIDLDNLPSTFTVFERVPKPPHTERGIFEVFEAQYQWVDGVVKDVWVLRPMTDDERAERIEADLKAETEILAWRKRIWASIIDSQTDPVIVQQAQQHLEALNQVVIVDPYNINWPERPFDPATLNT